MAHCNDAAMGEDGSMVLVGETDSSWASVNAGETDFVAVKLDADGHQVWAWQVWLSLF